MSDFPTIRHFLSMFYNRTMCDSEFNFQHSLSDSAVPNTQELKFQTILCHTHNLAADRYSNLKK